LRYIDGMSGVRRSLLIWLLAVLLPLQGWAASGSSPCGPGRHATPLQAAGNAVQVSDEHAHPRAQPSTIAHLEAHDPHGPADASAAADDAAPAGAEAAQQHDDTHACSACAACCPGAAPPGAPVTVVTLAPADVVPVVPGAGAANAFIGGLERPPRPIVA
jgi:hypothetical protein